MTKNQPSLHHIRNYITLADESNTINTMGMHLKPLVPVYNHLGSAISLPPNGCSEIYDEWGRRGK
jgi:hypothetical protein